MLSCMQVLEQNLIVVWNRRPPPSEAEYTVEEQAEDIEKIQRETKALLKLEQSPLVMEFPQIQLGGSWELAIGCAPLDLQTNGIPSVKCHCDKPYPCRK